MKKTVVLTTNLRSLTSNDLKKETFASIVEKDTRPITWATFILTDDIPNGNKQRVPKDEFANLISTGVFMPVKMKRGEIARGHKDSEPLGVISHLLEEKNQVYGLAALWDKERPEDIEHLKKLFDEDGSLQLSWEISYEKEEASAEYEGVTDLHDLTLNAVTLVGMPAYKGRTPITALASEDQEDILDELKVLQGKYDELETKYNKLVSEASTKEASLATTEAELVVLREFKAGIDEENEKAEKLAAIKVKFEEASLERGTEFFDEKADLLLSFTDEGLGFFIKELEASLKPDEDEEKKDTKAGLKIPNVSSQTKTGLTPQELAEVLRKNRNKSE